MGVTINISIIGGKKTDGGDLPWDIFHHLTSELLGMGWNFCPKTEKLILDSTGSFLPRFFAFDISTKTFVQTSNISRGDEQAILSLAQAQTFIDFIKDNAEMFADMPVVEPIEDELTTSEKILLEVEQKGYVSGQALSHTLVNLSADVTGSMDSHKTYELPPPSSNVGYYTKYGDHYSHYPMMTDGNDSEPLQVSKTDVDAVIQNLSHKTSWWHSKKPLPKVEMKKKSYPKENLFIIDSQMDFCTPNEPLKVGGGGSDYDATLQMLIKKCNEIAEKNLWGE